MKLADLPRRVVMPLGEWPEIDARLRKLERDHRFRMNNRVRLAQKTRESRKAA